jgi:hypothetical protein
MFKHSQSNSFVLQNAILSSSKKQSDEERGASLFAVRWSYLCTPGMGVNLWGESPLYMNLVPSFYDGNESTSRRQGHHREVLSEGS